MERVEFFAAVKEAAQQRQSLYKGNVKDRAILLDFLEANEWFGLGITNPTGTPSAGSKLHIQRDQADAICGRLHLWLDGFRRSNSEKLEILMQHGERTLPQTIRLYREFIEREGLADDISSWRLLDFLLYHLPGEISEMKTAEEGKLVDTLDREATRAVSELYARFNEWMQKKMGISGWQYRFEYRTERAETGAYSLRQFSGMAYCLFNDEWWRQECLVEKACASAVYANLWAFISMHFVCGLRSTDIIRIPMPDIGMDGVTFRGKIMAGSLKAPEEISRDMLIRIRYRPKRPNKTKSGSGIPDVKVFIPTSLEKPVGIILGIAASHCDGMKPGEFFLRADRSQSHTRNFFGREFMDLLGRKGFASSRANKAYLQGMEMMADTTEGSIRGYMIAALARSHKGGLATLPDVTDIYLRDAAFSGYKPEFIAREMFERGIFGFVPHLLLEAYAGNDYAGLPITVQTQMIRCMGISPSGIEGIVRACEVSLAHAHEAVEGIISSDTDIPSLIQEIASGRAVGKQEGCLCAMVGAGYPCAYPERAACIGCRYEIHTKSILHQLSSEYSRMRGLMDSQDGWRYKAMIRKAILPVIGEYLACMRGSISEADMGRMSEIMEGGLSGYADSSKQACGDGLQPVPVR